MRNPLNSKSRAAPSALTSMAWIVGTALLASAPLTGAAEPESPQHNRSSELAREMDFDIPAQRLSAAILKFSESANVQVVTLGNSLAGLTSATVLGHYRAEAALRHMLEGTGLTFNSVDGNTVSLVRVKRVSSSAESASMDLRVAQADSAQAADTSSVATSQMPTAQQGDTAGPTLEEVIVTAQKRSERLTDVPASITYIDSSRLQTLNVNSLSDLATYVPGLMVQDFGAPGSREVSLRGLQSGFNNESAAPMVATYVDDMPADRSTSANAGASGLDLSPYDIAGIEVLKGPQGTLYGANAMGGLIKYTLRKPDLEQVRGEIGADVGTINTGGTSYSAHAAISAPLIDNRLAVRLSGFYKYNAGWLDNVTLGQSEVNHATEQGGLASILWRATDALTLSADVIAQDIDAANLSVVTVDAATGSPLYGDNKFDTHFPQPFHQTTRLYKVSLDWQLGFATLTSTTGYSRIGFSSAWDLSSAFGLYCVPGSVGAAWLGCVDYPHNDALSLFQFGQSEGKFVEEMRLASAGTGRLNWMIGGFFTHEVLGGWYQNLPAFTPAGVELPNRDNFLQSLGNEGYVERAIFGNLTYKIGDHFDINGGVRHSIYSETDGYFVQTGLFETPAGSLPGPGNGNVPPSDILPDQNITLWMGGMSWHFTPDTMLYGRIATGYRPGAGCVTHSNGTLCGLHTSVLNISGIVQPDRTTNYEVGYKGELLEHRLMVSAAAFLINWTDMQVNEQSNGLNFPGNAGTARSTGFEVSTTYRATEGLTLNETVAFTDAHLTEDAVGVNGKNGDQLPLAARWTASSTVDYTRPLGDKTFLLGASYRYRDAVVNFFSLNPGGTYPIRPQNLADVYTGLSLNNFTVKLYGRNIFNNKSYAGLMYIDNPNQPEFIPVQPRTIGLSVGYHFH